MLTNILYSIQGIAQHNKLHKLDMCVLPYNANSSKNCGWSFEGTASTMTCLNAKEFPARGTVPTKFKCLTKANAKANFLFLSIGLGHWWQPSNWRRAVNKQDLGAIWNDTLAATTAILCQLPPLLLQLLCHLKGNSAAHGPSTQHKHAP